MASRIAAIARSGTAALMMANLGAAFMGIATGIVAARALGAQGRGDLAVIILWPALITTLVDLGIADAVTLRGARAPNAARTHYRIGLLLALGAGVGGLFIGVAALPVLLRSDQQSLMSLGLCALLSVPASALSAVPMGLLMGAQRFRTVAAIRFAAAFTYTCAMIVMTALGQGTVEVLTWLYVLARAVPFLLAAPLLWRGGPTTAPPAALRDTGGQFSEGVRLHGARLTYVVGAAEDRAIANWTLSQAGIGIWQVPHALTTVMQFVAQGVSQNLFARAARPGANREQLVFRAYERSIVATAAVALGGGLALPWLIPFAYGPDFAAAVAASSVVMVAAVPAAGALTLQAGAKAAQKARACVLLGGCRHRGHGGGRLPRGGGVGRGRSRDGVPGRAGRGLARSGNVRSAAVRLFGEGADPILAQVRANCCRGVPAGAERGTRAEPVNADV